MVAKLIVSFRDPFLVNGLQDLGVVVLKVFFTFLSILFPEHLCLLQEGLEIVMSMISIEDDTSV